MSDAPLILYVEDNPDNRLLVYRVLRAEGFNVETVPDGPSGLEFVENHIPDLILMDINLPKIDGYTMTARLKQRQELVNVPIIALTANVMKGDREKTIAAGCDGYIQKPINVDRLGDQIRAFLSNRPQKKAR
ncbi:MAG: response regulator [Chloroflexi bacterium]|nr:response regulator [Chloroflexota bacterium]MCI0580755.1 response regulator [Chloroflexota bacterium]MCI0644618.1 response regulator [Chloroflexota bacterium]MCI0727623.1 response regulator [Chloroflexota bacterium]